MSRKCHLQNFLKKLFKNPLTKEGIYSIIVERTKRGPLVKRLRRGPLKAEAWVRFPYGSPKKRQALRSECLSLFWCLARGISPGDEVAGFVYPDRRSKSLLFRRRERGSSSTMKFPYFTLHSECLSLFCASHEESHPATKSLGSKHCSAASVSEALQGGANSRTGHQKEHIRTTS